MNTKSTLDTRKRGETADEQAELQSVLDSGIFAKAPNLEKILRYICERYWSGEPDPIKEYSLAVEALGRRPDFDSSSDAIVRVEARRLREKLKDYYLKEGANHKLVICIPRGSYTPQFAPRTSLPDVQQPISSPEDTKPVLSGRQTNRKFILLVAGMTLAIAGIIFSLIIRHRATMPSKGPNRNLAAGTMEAIRPSVPFQRGVRIIAGDTRSSYIDHDGNSWEGDRYFNGGVTCGKMSNLILRTTDPDLYESCRSGNFSYKIPLQPGDYQLSLYFAEVFFGPGTDGGGGTASRLFRVEANGQTLLDHFDIVTDAGGNFIADERVFKNIHPSKDGFLHLTFISQGQDGLVNAIDIEPTVSGKLRPVQIVAQDHSYTDQNGNFWKSDRYFLGGRLETRFASAVDAHDNGLYLGERYGNFDYAIPAAPGKYTVTLYFSEQHFGPDERGGGGAGSRVFSVFSDGNTLLKDFDVFKTAGGSRIAVVKTFHNIEPNAQGKIDLRFEPDVNYAIINAISVIEESRK